MQKQLQIIFVFIVFFSCVLVNVRTFAAHGTASNDITYRWIDTLTYEVKYVYYRNCGSSSFGDPSSYTKLVCNKTGKGQVLSLTLKSVKEIKTTADTLGSQCAGVNADRSGLGTEQLIYLDTVDFNKAPFSSLLSGGCDEFRFETSMCCRNSALTTGSASSVNYNFAILSIKGRIQNSSPVFTFYPIMRFESNVPVYQTISAVDTIDGDSLSYNIVLPNSAYNKTISASYPPFTSYYPGSLKYPYTNSNANPPIGFYVNPETGDYVFTPIKANEMSAMVFEVKEWRKDKNGKYQNIGIVRRDIVCSITSAVVNNHPVVKGQFASKVCEGEEICYTITTEDKVKNPPPPLPKPDPDTVTIRWNRGIPGGRFVVQNDSALNQRARFCWQTKIGDARSLPYQFKVEADDDHFPYPSISRKTFLVSVLGVTQTKVSMDTLTCGKYVLTSNIDSSTAIYPLKYTWNVYPIKGYSSVDRNIPIFKSTNSYFSNKQVDTISFQRGGKYVIEHTINNRFNCPNTFYDTLLVPEVLEVKIAEQADTFVCLGSSLELTASVKNGSSNVNYLWSNAATKPNSTYTLPDSVKLKYISVEVTDTNGCLAKDEISLINRPLPIITPIQDIEICFGDSIDITPYGSVALWNDPRDTDTTLYQQGTDLKFSLYDNGAFVSNDTSFRLKNYTNYSIYVEDSLKCTDSTIFKVEDAHNFEVKDFDLCVSNGNINLHLIGPSSSKGAVWYCPTKKGAILKEHILLIDSFYANKLSKTLPIYYSYVHDKLGCEMLDSFKVTVHPLPDFELVDKRFCQNNSPLNVLNSGIVKTGNKSQFLTGNQNWSCIDCGTYNEYEIINDANSGSTPQEIQLYLDEKTVPLGSKNNISLKLELRVKSADGCSKTDTTLITVGKTSNISFDAFPDLCWDEGIVDLKVLSRVAPSNGIWKAVDSTGFAKATGLNVALSGDTLNGDTLFTFGTPRPVEGSFYTYLLRYTQMANGCLSYRDTTLTIRGLPEPIIDTKFLFSNGSSDPYSVCSNLSNIELKANYFGGTWSSSNPELLSGRYLNPSKIGNTNTAVTLYYWFTDIWGCQGGDSVKFGFSDPNVLKVTPKDTSITWYDEKMKLKVKAVSESGNSVIWEALDTGSFDDKTQSTTSFNYTTDKGKLTVLEVQAAEEKAINSCPLGIDTLKITVYPSPCVNFDMELTLSTNILKLTPHYTTLDQYIWTIGDTIIKEKSPSLDVSKFGDTILDIRLQTFNKLGDECKVLNRINRLNGSVKNTTFAPLLIYPNPVNDVLTFKSNLDLSDCKVLIYSSVGQIVMDTQTKDGSLNCSTLVPGVYTVVLIKDNTLFNGRFLKN